MLKWKMKNKNVKLNILKFLNVKVYKKQEDCMLCVSCKEGTLVFLNQQKPGIFRNSLK